MKYIIGIITISIFCNLHLWAQGVDITNSPLGAVVTYGMNGDTNSVLSGYDNNFGLISVHDDLGDRKGIFYTNSTTKHGVLELRGDNSLNILLDATGTNKDKGWIGLYDESSISKSNIGIAQSEEGYIELNGANNTLNVLLGGVNGSPDLGFVGVYDEFGTKRSSMFVSPTTGGGNLEVLGTNGLPNVIAASATGNPDNGYIAAVDQFGNEKAGAFVDGSGNGVIFGDVKNFRMEHPTQPDKDIWYACIEGPEAAAYVRGTAKLENGEAIIELPEHFMHVASSENITILLTPLSARAKGLAAVEKDLKAGKVKVRELFNGTGNYDFDWEIKAVRKGHENYQVIRDKSYAKPAIEIEEPETIKPNSNPDVEPIKWSEFNNLQHPDAIAQKAVLKQNMPNPFHENTTIEYYVPAGVKKAMLQIISKEGQLLKSYNITDQGVGSITIQGKTLSSGQYYYGLTIDGTLVGTKSMVLTK